VQVAFQRDEFGRLTCDLNDGATNAVVTASNMPEAQTSLATAIDAVLSRGLGECFWEEACGEYRWVFRREQDKVRVAVMWSTGTVTGWEHVFWSETDVNTFAGAFRSALETV
jgi:hypothetical protein